MEQSPVTRKFYMSTSNNRFCFLPKPLINLIALKLSIHDLHEFMLISKCHETHKDQKFWATILKIFGLDIAIETKPDSMNYTQWASILTNKHILQDKVRVNWDEILCFAAKNGYLLLASHSLKKAFAPDLDEALKCALETSQKETIKFLLDNGAEFPTVESYVC